VLLLAIKIIVLKKVICLIWSNSLILSFHELSCKLEYPEMELALSEFLFCSRHRLSCLNPSRSASLVCTSLLLCFLGLQ